MRPWRASSPRSRRSAFMRPGSAPARRRGPRCSSTSRYFTIGSACTRPWDTEPRPRLAPAWRRSPCARQPDVLISPLHTKGGGPFAEGLIERREFEPRVADLRARIAQLEEQRTALVAAAEARRDLTLAIGRLADFSAKGRQTLDLLDWTTRRDVIRLMVRRIAIDDGQIEIIFRIPPLSGGPGRDTTPQL